MAENQKVVENLEKIEDKLDKGEALSPQEEKILNDAETPGEPIADEEIDPTKEKVAVEEDAEETPSEKGEETAPSKKEEAESAAVEADRKKLIEADAEKPLDEVDLENYTPRERALFFELKEERVKRQSAQREADTLKFDRAKREERERIEAEKAAKEAEAEPDPFEGMEDDDLLTAGQMKKLLAKKEPKGKPQQAEDKTSEPIRKLQMENWVLKAQAKIPDILDVLKFTDEFCVGDPIATEAVSEVVRKGGNPLIATYNYLKSHPKHWAVIEARLKKSSGSEKNEDDARTNKERAARIEANKKKPVTTGSGGGAPSTGEYTIQELLDMPNEEFAKLPRSTREKVLESF